jgi:hypothetical protein
MGNGTFELNNGTTSTVEKRQSARPMQQRIQQNRDISIIASCIGRDLAYLGIRIRTSIR